MIKKGSKQEKLIHTAKDLFMKHGINRVTVAEICKEAGVSKMTFYKYYTNKGELAKEMMLEVAEEGMEEYRSVMRQEIPFSKKVNKLIQIKLRDTENISQEFVRDLYKDDKLNLLGVLEEKSKESMNEYIRDFEKAAKNGDIRKGINSQFIVYFLHKISEMTADPHLLSFYKNEQELIMELTKFFFYGLGVKDETN